MKKLLLCSLALPILAGCALMSGRTYVEPRDYDLTLAPAPQINHWIVIGGFRNLSGTDRRFLFRENNGEMTTDDYNRWLLSPDQLLTRKVYEQFSGEAKKGESVRLNGTIYQFEFDRNAKKAIFGISYSLRPQSSQEQMYSFSTEESAADDSSAAYAAAMSKCVERFFAHISSKL